MQLGQRGVSLVSILVTLSIILILTGISTYMFQYATKTAKRAWCANNLRQIYQYWLLYLDENHDRIRRIRDLQDSSLPEKGSGVYLKNVLEQFLSQREKRPIDLTAIFSCPADPLHNEYELKHSGSYDNRDEMSRSYRPYVFSDIPNPQDKILMGDYRSGWHAIPFFGLFGYDSQSDKERRINVLFADGRVEWLTEKEWQDQLRLPFWD